MTERATMYMSGSPKSVVKHSFSNGPSPRRQDVIDGMREGDVLVGMNQRGEVVLRERMMGDVLRPWEPSAVPDPDEETDPAAFLRDLANKLMRVPGVYGIDQQHVDRLDRIAAGLERADVPADGGMKP